MKQDDTGWLDCHSLYQAFDAKDHEDRAQQGYERAESACHVRTKCTHVNSEQKSINLSSKKRLSCMQVRQVINSNS